MLAPAMPAPITMISKLLLMDGDLASCTGLASNAASGHTGAMSEATLHFPLAEYQRRIAKTRSAMMARNLDLIVVSDPSNMGWLTGYDGWSFYVHQAVLLGLEGEPVWWGRGMDANGAKRTAFMGHDNIVGYPDHYVQSPERHPMEQLSEVIAERGWSAARIGLEMDNYWFSAKAYTTLRSTLREADLQDSTGLVNWQRSVKSDLEVAFIRKAAKIVDAMHTTVFDLVEPGLAQECADCRGPEAGHPGGGRQLGRLRRLCSHGAFGA